MMDDNTIMTIERIQVEADSRRVNAFIAFMHDIARNPILLATAEMTRQIMTIVPVIQFLFGDASKVIERLYDLLRIVQFPNNTNGDILDAIVAWLPPHTRMGDRAHQISPSRTHVSSERMTQWRTSPANRFQYKEYHWLIFDQALPADVADNLLENYNEPYYGPIGKQRKNNPQEALKTEEVGISSVEYLRQKNARAAGTLVPSKLNEEALKYLMQFSDQAEKTDGGENNDPKRQKLAE